MAVYALPEKHTKQTKITNCHDWFVSRNCGSISFILNTRYKIQDVRSTSHTIQLINVKNCKS
jgi:hypothetical protein